MNEAKSTIVSWYRINELRASDRSPNGTKLELQGSGATMGPVRTESNAPRKTSTKSLNRLRPYSSMSSAFSSLQFSSSLIADALVASRSRTSNRLRGCCRSHPPASLPAYKSAKLTTWISAKPRAALNSRQHLISSPVHTRSLEAPVSTTKWLPGLGTLSR
jgi:hypothetical protein